MRAAVVRNYGGPEAAEIVEVERPEPGPGQVRIRFAAGAVNPVDRWVLAGDLTRAGMIPADRAVAGLGWDVAGTVDALGDGVADLNEGDAVVGVLVAFGPENRAAQAEYVVLDRDAVAAAPVTVDAIAASTLPLNAITALQALDLAAPAAGETVLITGAAGAVGGYAVELAARRGLRVIGLARAGDVEEVRGFGAEAVLADVAELEPASADVVIDAAGIGGAAIAAVRAGGRYVALTPSRGIPEAPDGVTVLPQMMHADRAALERLVRAVDAGELTLRVAETFPLSDVSAAYAAAAKPGLRGRVVLVAD